ncbi:hypothetical protein RB195_025989 [Necator americanus]|uniref:Uncharacterized protein n=1 Tax=Necator americanus TaxID=51031 RepID=A0ABR1EUU1_NECAM
MNYEELQCFEKFSVNNVIESGKDFYFLLAISSRIYKCLMSSPGLMHLYRVSVRCSSSIFRNENSKQTPHL